MSALVGRVPKRALHLPNIDWTVQDHRNINQTEINVSSCVLLDIFGKVVHAKLM